VWIMSKPVNMNIDMTNCLGMDVKGQFDNRRFNALESLAETMSKVVNTEYYSIVEDVVSTANQLDELWKQECKNASRRGDFLQMISDAAMRNNNELEQQKTILEKRIQELEANVVSSSSSLDSEDKKHDNNYYVLPDTKNKKSMPSESKPTHIGGAGLVQSDEKNKKSKEFIPKINKKNLKEVFKYSNYYSQSKLENLVSERILRWHKRSIPELMNSLSTNDARLKKAEHELNQVVAKVPKWLIVKLAITRLVASKKAAEAALEQAALDRAALQARQDKERRDQRIRLENAKRAHEDIRDSMMHFRSKKPSIEPVHVHFSEAANEYDYDDGFTAHDHESEPDSESSSESEDKSSSDDELGALSDAVNDLDVGEAAVENLDE